MPTLTQTISSFIAELRAAGVRISLAETLDAMRAVTASGLERTRMREALAATLVKDEADRPTFDEVFARCFGNTGGAHGANQKDDRSYSGVHGRGGQNTMGFSQPRAEEEPASLFAPAKAATPEERRSSAPLSEQDTYRAMQSDATSDEDMAEDRGFAKERAGSSGYDASAGDAARQKRLRTIERLPFAQYSELEYEIAREALAPLIRRFRVRVSRRLHIAKSGRLDFRRTIRAAIQRGGTLTDLRMRARRRRHIDLVLLADISGSVKYASELMLEMAAGAQSCFRRVRSFVFIDHMAEAAFEHGRVTMAPQLDLYAHSDCGLMLRELWERRTELLGRATVVVIMGDGRNNRRPPRADLLRHVAELCRAVIWLNPEPTERWNTGDSAIAHYEQVVDAMIPCENLKVLEREFSSLS
jgi:uncharacterized protein with von Willebrand factor type A (vWA) domain